jgi:1-deoxy-D-xylulose-5-phosphate reductoisomerase
MSTSPSMLTILGATGSIGLNTLDVVSRYPDNYEIFALTAHTNIKKLYELCLLHKPKIAVTSTEIQAKQLADSLRAAGLKIKIFFGEEGLSAAASASEVTHVMAAIVGGAGLVPTLAAARAGKIILLANKEAIVMGGNWFLSIAEQAKAVLLPIDSEHNAIFQCLPINLENAKLDDSRRPDVKKILLTASGGPFLTRPLETFSTIRPEEACAHPNWKMGRKISVDSATMINKALELIEATLLFSMPASQIQVLIHPESIIHSMVAYKDGSVLAQLGNPDMRTPIAHALAWPNRIESGVEVLDLISTGQLNFLPVDFQRFPGIALGRQVAEARDCSSIVFNAANEVAVANFLAGQGLRFNAISEKIDEVLQLLSKETSRKAEGIEDILALDAKTREITQNLCQRGN